MNNKGLFLRSDDPLVALMKQKIPGYCADFSNSNNQRILLRILEETVCKDAELLLKRSGQWVPPFNPLIIRRGKAKIDLRFVEQKSSSQNASLPTTERIMQSKVEDGLLPEKSSSPLTESILLPSKGSLLPSDEGFRIEVEKTRSKNTEIDSHVRTTIAHEVGHTFFYDVSILPPKPIGVISSEKSYWAIENMSFAIGRTLLMPKFSVLKTLASKPNLRRPSIDNLDRLKRIYKVSRDIVAWRIIKDLNIWKSCFLKSKIVKKGEKTKFQSIPMPLKNKYAKELDFIKLSRVIDETNELYPHLLRVSEKTKDKSVVIEDIVRVNGNSILLQSRVARNNIIVTLISSMGSQYELLGLFL